MSLIKIARRNRMFSPLGIEAKHEDDELHFNKRPEYNAW